MKWISVMDSLPNKEQMVLFLLKDGEIEYASISIFEEEVECSFRCFLEPCKCLPRARVGNPPIYWMPLPEPPKDKK